MVRHSGWEALVLPGITKTEHMFVGVPGMMGCELLSEIQTFNLQTLDR
jgi:hypothetical protein